MGDMKKRLTKNWCTFSFLSVIIEFNTNDVKMSNLFHIQYIYLNYKMCYINDSNILFLIKARLINLKKY